MSEITQDKRPRGKRSILFMEDDATALHGLERGLYPFRIDWEMVFASNPARARELTKARRYDAVLVSMRIAGQAAELLKHLSAQAPAALYFVVGNPNDPELQRLQPLAEVVSREWNPETLAAHFKRAFRLQDWTASEAIQKLMARMERLPSLPALYSQVTAELSKPDGSIQFVGRLIAKDPAMTAKILQMVGSAVFSLEVEVTDPGDAVLYLGAERTKALILLANMSLQFDKTGCAGFSHPQLWQHSMAVGALAQTITMAQTKDIKMADMAFTAGLLHDIGKLLLAANLPEDYRKVLQLAQGKIHSVAEAEMSLLGANHAVLGASVLGSWGLPVAILESIAWHHCPQKSEDRGFSILTGVHVANALEQEKRLQQNTDFASQIDLTYIERLRLADCYQGWRKACGLPPRKN